MLPIPQVYEELEERALSGGMHDMSKEGRRDAMEVYMVLSECLWVVHAGAIFYTGERFEALFEADREIEKELALVPIERLGGNGVTGD